MGTHQVWNQKLLQAQLVVQLLIFRAEALIDRVFWFAHAFQHRIADMFRSDLQLAAHMILNQFPEKAVIRIRQQVIKTDPGTDEYLLHSRKRAQLTKQFQIVLMIRFQIRAGPREKALAVLAYALGQLLFTGRGAEIGGGPSYIMDITFEILILYDLPRLFQNGFVAAYLDDPALVEGERTETALLRNIPGC